jgi:hypothetical protein
MNANSNDEIIDIITVNAIPPTNSMLDPSPVTMGMNAKTVVAVAAIKGVDM